MKKLLLAILLILLFSGLAQGKLIKNGSTDVIVHFIMRDKTNGTRDTGIVIAELVMKYTEQQTAMSADVSNDLTHSAATDAHNDGEIIHLGEGEYRTDWPNAAFDGGVGKFVTLTLKDGGGGAFTETIEVELSAPVDVVSVGGTTQTANDMSGDMDILVTQVGTAGDGLTNIDLPNQIMDITGNLSGSVGSLIGHTVQSGDSYAIVNSGTYGLSIIEGQTDDIGVAGAGLTAINLPNQTMDITGGLSGSVGSVTAGVTLGNDSITSDKIADDAFSAEHYATNSLTADAFATDSITKFWSIAMVDLDAGPPAYNAAANVALNWMFTALRNKVTTVTMNGNTETRIYKDDGTTILAESDGSDDGTTFTKGEYRAED